MEAIEAVLDLAKERDQLAEELETYEDWFEELVGRKVTLSVKEEEARALRRVCRVRVCRGRGLGADEH
jgi:hypothetical protein